MADLISAAQVIVRMTLQIDQRAPRHTLQQLVQQILATGYPRPGEVWILAAQQLGHGINRRRPTADTADDIRRYLRAQRRHAIRDPEHRSWRHSNRVTSHLRRHGKPTSDSDTSRHRANTGGQPRRQRIRRQRSLRRTDWYFVGTHHCWGEMPDQVPSRAHKCQSGA
jgi:hypothetical protein